VAVAEGTDKSHWTSETASSDPDIGGEAGVRRFEDVVLPRIACMGLQAWGVHRCLIKQRLLLQGCIYPISVNRRNSPPIQVRRRGV
jgi:hypothetical protein